MTVTQDSDMDPSPRERRSTMERHAQTIIGSLVFALMTWVGVALLDVKERLARIETRQLLTSGDQDRAVRQYEELERRVRDVESAVARNAGR